MRIWVHGGFGNGSGLAVTPNIILLNDNKVTTQASLEALLTGETITYFLDEPGNTEAKSDTNYTVNNDAFKGTSTSVRNPITYVKMGNATAVGTSAFQFCSLNEVDFPNATSIGNSSFRDGVGIETGYFPLLNSIASSGFYAGLKSTTQIRQDISGLGILYIPSVTTLNQIQIFNINNLTGSWSNVSSSATHYVPNITSYSADFMFSSNNFSKIELTGITSINGFYSSGTYPTMSQTDPTANVYIPNVDTLGNQSFGSCGIVKADLPNVTTVRGLYANSFTSVSQTDPSASVYIPNATTIGYKGLGQMNGLTSIDLPYVTTVIEQEAFRGVGCTSISTDPAVSADLQLNSLLPGGLNSQEGAFNQNSNLQSAYLPRILTLGYSLFNSCQNVAFTTVSQTDPSASVYAPDAVNTFTTNYTNVFSGCNQLTSVSLPYVNQIGSGYFQNCTSLAKIDLNAITSIPPNSFNNCDSLITVSQTDPSASLYVPNVTSFGSTSCFLNANNITSVDFPSVISIGSASQFSGCSNLSYINLPGLITTNIGTNAGNQNMFQNTALSGSITVPVRYATNNAGAPDGDIQYLIDRAWTVTYV